MVAQNSLLVHMSMRRNEGSRDLSHSKRDSYEKVDDVDDEDDDEDLTYAAP